MSTPVRVRFAPSPTGHLHVGSIRSALHNWLWARHNDGTFVLRLEDTDRARLVPGAAEQIYASHAALGITPDEGPEQGGGYGPYIQSERLHLYRDYADKLVASGDLYPCWCTPERLTTLREIAQASGTAFKYDRHCLQHPGDTSQPHVLRFRIPHQTGSVSWDDAVRGHNEWQTADLDDFVALKSDGYPTYHLANVIDDHLMQISHVMRADEWLPSTPKHLLLFAAFGWEPPIYAHLPAILGPGGNKKLSKRDGAQSVQEYIEEGYLPEALRSFLATLGWNDGTTQEVYSTHDLIEKFTLERIQKSPAMFDKTRLEWLNGVMIRELSVEELWKRCSGFWPEVAGESDKAYQLQVLGLVQERLKFLAELPELTTFFFVEPTVDVELLTKQLPVETAGEYLTATIERLAATTWNEVALEAAIRELAEALGAKTGHYFGLLRVAITGQTAAPGLFETMLVLGSTTTLSRLQAALQALSS